jgi:ABC-type thiamine transport system substrate-binding protein
MGKRHGEHPFEDSPFVDDFLEWMGSPEGQRSIGTLDIVWPLLENADVDAKKRKIIWEDGQRLSITESVQRIHADHPDLPLEVLSR